MQCPRPPIAFKCTRLTDGAALCRLQVNTHGNAHVIQLFEGLGYQHHRFASFRLRDNRPGHEAGLPPVLSENHAWLQRSLLVFERWRPLGAGVEGCGGG